MSITPLGKHLDAAVAGACIMQEVLFTAKSNQGCGSTVCNYPSLQIRVFLLCRINYVLATLFLCQLEMRQSAAATEGTPNIYSPITVGKIVYILTELVCFLQGTEKKTGNCLLVRYY